MDPNTTPNASDKNPVPVPAPTTLRGALRHLGPGLIVAAAIVGSGELIVTPKLGAKVGFGLLWFVVLSCVIKVFVQIELGRLSISTGMGTLSAMDKVPGPRLRVSWLVWFCLLMYVAILFQLSGILGAVVQLFVSQGVGLSEWVLGVLLVGSYVALLLAGRYKVVELVSTLKVVVFTGTTLFAVIALQWTPYRFSASDLASGFTFSMPDSFVTAFALFGVTGVGASELIFYPYWCLEKGYAKKTGPRDSSAAWGERAQGWAKVMSLDAALSLVVYTVATTAFYLLGAAVLHKKSLEVKNEEMISTLSQMYYESVGAVGLIIFLVGAFFVLYMVIYVSAASIARLFTDAFSLLGLVKEGQRERSIRWGEILLPCVCGAIFLLVRAPVSLVLVGALAQGLMLPFLGGMALYFHYQERDERLRPTLLWTCLLWLSALTMASIGLYQARDQIVKLF